MVGQGNRVLISYNDVQNRNAAMKLGKDLSNNNMDVVAKGYNEEVNLGSYNWLILMYTPEVKRTQMYSTVENALNLTVQRRMRGVLAITSGPAELPPEWATIRKYDASTPPETIRQAMSYAKTPYTRERMQELVRTSSPALSRSRNKYPSTRSLIVASLATIMTLLGVVAFFIAPLLHPTSPQQATVIISNPATATAQAKQVATAQAFRSATLVAVASAQASATAAAPSIAQKQFDKVTNTSPKFPGFQSDEKWDKTASCVLTSQNTTYQATVAIAGQYVRCMANATLLKNFAYQVTLNINGDAGGVIFRSEGQTGIFYRFSVTPSNSKFAVILCQSDCAENTTNGGILITGGQVLVDINTPITLTIIAKDSIIDLYINGKFVDQLNDQLASPGAIGVYAASISNPTTVTFTNPKVWQL